MPHADLRSPPEHPDLAVIASTASANPASAARAADSDGWWLHLKMALQDQGFTVQQAEPERCGFAAFMAGAAAVVLAPPPDVTPAQAWLELCDRAARMLPTAMVWLPADRSEEVSDWLEAGFDDVVVGVADPAGAALRLAARARSRPRRQSLASVDALTGLPTWHVFSSRLDPTVRLSSRAGMPMAVAVLDMDGFRQLEADAGRGPVRQVLVDVAAHLRAALRRSDTVARLGDDRFGLLLHHITAFEARRLMYKLWRSLSLPPETAERLGPYARPITFTAGVAVFPGDASDGHELYMRAEIALDCARASGHRRVLLFSETSGEAGSPTHATDLRWHRTGTGRGEDPE